MTRQLSSIATRCVLLTVYTMDTSSLRRAARIILIGAPGVGKGTQTERLLKRFPQLSSISSGDLLRENVRNKTPLGERIISNAVHVVVLIC